LLTGYIAPDFTLARPARVLNAFACACGFSVCAAAGGARVTSLDLSKKSLDWGKRNFALNGLEPAAHNFIFGDAFAWFRRLAKKGRLFDVIILDPPTFSRSREHGVFRAEKDYGTLAAAALPLLERDGVLLASTNAATLPPERFLEMVALAVTRAGRRVTRQHYAPQPPDFPAHRQEPACLKTVWLRVS
jgi:23S rRNA (cytosine1962-C5)-methyltransferase